MKSKIFLIIFYIIFGFISNLLSAENDKKLKVGLLAPLSGPYSEIGNSLLYSLQLALEEIDDENVTIIPKDSVFNNSEKINIERCNNLYNEDDKEYMKRLYNESELIILNNS